MKTELNNLTEYLSHKPEACLNWRGNHEPIPWPKGQIVARCGDVFMMQQSKDRFAVVYCLQAHSHLSRTQAAREFGECCLHQAQSTGLLN